MVYEIFFVTATLLLLFTDLQFSRMGTRIWAEVDAIVLLAVSNLCVSLNLELLIVVCWMGFLTQKVEHQHTKLKVTGSSPAKGHFFS